MAILRAVCHCQGHLDSYLQVSEICHWWLLQAQKEALQSGLVTMHDIEMMAVDDEGSIKFSGVVTSICTVFMFSIWCGCDYMEISVWNCSCIVLEYRRGLQVEIGDITTAF